MEAVLAAKCFCQEVRFGFIAFLPEDHVDCPASVNYEHFGLIRVLRKIHLVLL